MSDNTYTVSAFKYRAIRARHKQLVTLRDRAIILGSLFGLAFTLGVVVHALQLGLLR